MNSTTNVVNNDNLLNHTNDVYAAIRDVAKPLCNLPGHNPASVASIDAIIPDMNTNGLGHILQGGLAMCKVISCNGIASTTLCNDNTYEIMVSEKDAGVLVQAINATCSGANNVMGQQFDPGNWNVFVEQGPQSC